MFNLNNTDWGARSGFDQNRFFFGLGYKLNESGSLSLEVGYLNQYLYRRSATDRMNHIFSVNLFLNL